MRFAIDAADKKVLQCVKNSRRGIFVGQDIDRTVNSGAFSALCLSVVSNTAAGGTLDAAASEVVRLSKGHPDGSIEVRGKKGLLPRNAGISFSRTRAETAERRVREGLAHRRGAGRAMAMSVMSSGRTVPAAAPPAVKEPRVLAMYDVSIASGGRKWQPSAGEPVEVAVELSEPVDVAADSTLSVVHMADDGTVDELEAGRYGFTYNDAGDSAGYSFVIELGNYEEGGDWSALAISEAMSYGQLLNSKHAIVNTDLGIDPSVLAPWNPQTYVVPEPSSGLMLVVGAALLALRRKRERAHG